MRVCSGSETFPPEKRGCVLTIGNFDGVHLGHRAVLGSAIERARTLGVSAVAYTFHPHPRRVLEPERAQPLLMTLTQLEFAIEKVGIDLLVREPFSLQFSSMSPEVFLQEIIGSRIRPTELFVGRDFHFGKGRGGSDETLARLAPTLGIRVVIVPEVQAGGADVSSTRIRGAIAAGDVEEATLCLGQPYSISGRVVEGDRRGREIGFPTANLALDNELLPTNGVYATRVWFFDAHGRRSAQTRPAVTNVGTRPTFDAGPLVTEVHLLDFDEDLYGERLEVAFHSRLRGEKRFPSVDALKTQIAADVEQARGIVGDPSE
jgi:riboflavin kinase/FMN adenylyltransferase